MANDNYPRGLVPLGWPGNCDVQYFRVATNNDIYLGELVDFNTTGYVTNALDVTTAGIIQALGSVVGFAGPNKKGLAGNNTPYLKAADLTTLATGLDAGDRWVAVACNPNQEYVIQGDTGATLATMAAQGEAFALIYRGGGSGNTTSGWANLELDASTNSVTTGQIVRLVRFHDNINVDGTENTTANYAKYVVQIMNPRLRGLGGAAV